MTIHKHENDTELILALEGRLDTTTSPELEKLLKESLDGRNDRCAVFHPLLNCHHIIMVSIKHIHARHERNSVRLLKSNCLFKSCNSLNKFR